MTNRQQLFRFILFSGSAAVIQIIVFSLLFEQMEEPYWISYVISLLALIFWNTFWNRKYTFQSNVKFRVAIFKLILFYLVFIPIFTYLGDTCISYGWNEYLVLLMTMTINLILAFFYNRIVIYKQT